MPGKYRIAHLAYTFVEEDGRVLRYLKTLALRGHEVEVFCLRRPQAESSVTMPGIKVFRVQKRTVDEKRKWAYLFRIAIFFLRAMLLISTRHINRPYNLVHVHNVPEFLIFTAWLPKLAGAKIILDIHDIFPELYASKFQCRADSRLFRSILLVERLSAMMADWVIAANDIWKKRLMERSVPPSKCSSLINFPDVSVFRPTPPTGDCAADRKFVILYPGSLNEHQGLDVAIKALDLIKGRIPEAELHIYGQGPALPSLKKLASDLGLDGRVLFHKPVSINEIASIMSRANVGVIPKKADGFGDEAFSTKSMEFMSCGVPVVMSRTSVDTLYFTDRHVLFFPSGDAEALAEAIWEIYSHPDLAQARVQEALKLVARENWSVHEKDYLAIVEKLLSREHAP